MTTADSQFGMNPVIAAKPGRDSRRPKFILNPFRLAKRRERLEREALEEAQHLRRRHGDGAVHAARQKLLRPDLTHWGRKVIQRAVKLLQTQV